MEQFPARATVTPPRVSIPSELQASAAIGVWAAAESLHANGELVPMLPVSRMCVARHAALMVLASLPSDITVARAIEVLSNSSLPSVLVQCRPGAEVSRV